ncbi:hypothetical protein OVA26_17310 [Microbacterium sp. SL62]|uniref:hypothetical protein n=1 Tax=Microbacterium sp. SL62 TaxID=2995139 RepID=UPI002275A2C2|nr:hypothetical protein [Microbacterium sp. SL62]MCY1718697.1 hypothetical protein [Microbacterium sp. SL62]
MKDNDEIAFWQALSAEFEGRARAAGTQMQTSAALAVTAVAGGLLAAGAKALLALPSPSLLPSLCGYSRSSAA